MTPYCSSTEIWGNRDDQVLDIALLGSNNGGFIFEICRVRAKIGLTGTFEVCRPRAALKIKSVENKPPTS